MKIVRTGRGPTVLVTVAAVAATVAATVAAPPWVAAQPASPAAADQPATGAPVFDGVPPGRYTVTLVTGDTVTVDTQGAGPNIEVAMATRPDGSTPAYRRDSDRGGVYVIPSDAQAAVTSGLLDRYLFNVEYLVENGYTDAQTAQLPVIVRYPAARARGTLAAAQALPGSTATTDLASVHGAGVSVPKSQAGAFWTAVRGTAATAPGISGASTRSRVALGSGIARVSLDRKVQVDLSESVPLIGAPQAWAAGHDGTGATVAVLDTGVDLTHPDLAGRLGVTRSFVPGVESVEDGHGHGTHVASTIAGTGAASGGTYKGVAPGVRLNIGKVLNDTGGGMFSWIIEGMEWAAASGADVVSMSIGTNGTASDGRDELSQAVNELTATTGTLFVIAAGNDGPSESTITAPGAADAALTVAATTKSDGLAGFSSRGPRFIDGALKPDIAAPGVSIVAARAKGWTIPNPRHVDEHYSTLNGTSMATPHVSGAAAILAAQHPDWTPGQLKAALMSTATDAGHSVYEQGAGRVDVARADAQHVYALTPNLDFGTVPDGAAPVTRQVEYSNQTDQPLTLTLTVTGAGGLSTDPTVTVPAQGTATASVALDPAALEIGTHSANLLAQADGVRVTTPIGIVRQLPAVDLTLHVLNRDGQPVPQTGIDFINEVVFKNLDTGLFVTPPLALNEPGTVRTRVPAGTYEVDVVTWWVDTGYQVNIAIFIKPEVTIEGDRAELTFDARQTSELRHRTPVPTTPLTEVGWERYLPNDTGNPEDTEGFLAGGGVPAFGRLWMAPTEPVTMGRFVAFFGTVLERPTVMMAVRRPAARQLTVYPGGSTKFPAGTGTRTLVDAGSARPEQLSGLDLRGKLVLVDDDPDDGDRCGVHQEVLQRLSEAGVFGVVVFVDAERGSCPNPFGVWGPFMRLLEVGEDVTQKAPWAALPRSEGLALREQLGQEQVTVTVEGTPVSPYTYTYTPVMDRIPRSLTFDLADSELARVDADLHSATPTVANFQHTARSRDMTFAASATPTSQSVPGTVRQYIGPLDPNVFHSRGAGMDPSTVTDGRLDVFDRPTRTREAYNAGPMVPAPSFTPEEVYALQPPHLPFFKFGWCGICRQKDTLWTNFAGGRGTRLGSGFFVATVYGPDGTVIPPGDFGEVVLPPEPATYRVTGQTVDTAVEWTVRSAGTTTTQTSRSGVVCRGSGGVVGDSKDPCRAEPVIFVRYDMEGSLALDNSVAANAGHTFRLVPARTPSTAPMPAIAGVKLWVSTDDGAHWVPVSLRRDRDGGYTATARYPKYLDTTGAVSFRTEAWDVEGNRLKQTTMRGVTLRDTRSGNRSTRAI